MNIKKFFLVSIVFHLVLLVIAYYLPAPAVKKSRDFLTRLVTPEEIQREVVPPPVQPVPVIPSPPKALKPAPAVPHRKVPPPPPKTMLTPDRPVVPGMGKEQGRPLPEGMVPRPGGGSRPREGTPGELSEKPGYEQGSKPQGQPGASRLFDPGVIGSAALKEKGGGGAGRKDDAITFDTSEYRYAGYMKKLKEKIESIWEYPAAERKKGIYGDLKIRFTINKDGRLGSVELVRTSGYKALDDAALKALKDGEPYWPLPDDWGTNTYTVQGHFIYTLYGYGIR